jgi:hypothetical protein
MAKLKMGLFPVVFFLTTNALCQQKGRIKLDAIQAGVSWIETEFKNSSFPFMFESFLPNGASFPNIAYDNYYRRNAVQQDYLWQLDADWRWQKSGKGAFWKQARFQTGLVYSQEMIPGQSLGTQNDVVLPDGVERKVNLYSNDMQYNLLGLQLGWKQNWQPFRKAQRLTLFTGISWMNLWTLNNEITQSNYYLHYTSTASGGYRVMEETTTNEPNISGKNFLWQRWQLPVGVSYRFGKNIGVAAEFNLGIYRYVKEGKRGTYDEAHGFSTRLGYYF